MHRKLLLLGGCLAGLMGVAAPANAERVFVYGYGPVRDVIYAPAPVVYQPAPVVVSYDPDERFARPYDLQGVVTNSVPYHVTVRINGDLYQVSLHDGTIIKPTGITLTPTMVVNVAGYWSGTQFVANRIVVLRY